MGIKEKYAILQVSKEWVEEMIEEEHYLHRYAPISYNFGLFNRKTKDILGVASYGTPASSSLRKGVCGEEERMEVIELMRLWTNDKTPRNTESYLIGNTIPKVDKDIIVSYADPNAGHIGYVYQATNWLYTGISNKTDTWILDGEEKHSHTITDRFSRDEIHKMKKEGRLEVVKNYSGKHRYIYLNCNKRRKRELKKKLKYEIKPYPKGDTN